MGIMINVESELKPADVESDEEYGKLRESVMMVLEKFDHFQVYERNPEGKLVSVRRRLGEVEWDVWEVRGSQRAAVVVPEGFGIGEEYLVHERVRQYGYELRVPGVEIPGYGMRDELISMNRGPLLGDKHNYRVSMYHHCGGGGEGGHVLGKGQDIRSLCGSGLANPEGGDIPAMFVGFDAMDQEGHFFFGAIV